MSIKPIQGAFFNLSTAVIWEEPAVSIAIRWMARVTHHSGTVVDWAYMAQAPFRKVHPRRERAELLSVALQLEQQIDYHFRMAAQGILIRSGGRRMRSVRSIQFLPWKPIPGGFHFESSFRL